MSHTSDGVCQFFLERSSPKDKEKFLSFLDEEQKKKIFSEEKIKSLDFLSFSKTIDTLLDEVHYSWLLPTFNTQSKKDMGYFLLIFDKDKQQKIKKQIPKLTLPRKKLSEASARFFQNLLTSTLLPEDFLLLPPTSLPPSPLNELLNLTKQELIFLLDLLSLYDLKAELKSLVDKTTLEKIESCLTKEKKAFLYALRSEKEPLSLPKMGLLDWDGNPKIFHDLLHKRGLNRLSQCLSGKSPSLLWHISHRLDIGRGELLLKLAKQKPHEEVGKILEKSLFFTLSYLKHQKAEKS